MSVMSVRTELSCPDVAAAAFPLPGLRYAVLCLIVFQSMSMSMTMTTHAIWCMDALMHA